MATRPATRRKTRDYIELLSPMLSSRPSPGRRSSPPITAIYRHHVLLRHGAPSRPIPLPNPDMGPRARRWPGTGLGAYANWVPSPPGLTRFSAEDSIYVKRPAGGQGRGPPAVDALSARLRRAAGGAQAGWRDRRLGQCRLHRRARARGLQICAARCVSPGLHGLVSSAAGLDSRAPWRRRLGDGDRSSPE
ncbi:hypothetical protein FQR65_LT20400 [Abscondita terminalis]|nr:hypothetical protein FQR65_LT20400 [Abscondita terminalis]